MSTTSKLVIFVFLSMFLVCRAHAQIAINPAPATQPICVDKKDAYSLALADMQGTLSKKWTQFVHEGRCRYMPSTYLFTIDKYDDIDHEPSRVIELLAFGERVWGIRGSLPPSGVWMMAWDGVKTAASEWYEKQDMNPEIQQRLGVSWKSCCNNADVYKTQFHVDRDNADAWWYWHKTELVWKLVPSDAVQTGIPTPTGEPVMFVYQGVVTCFFPGEGGI